MKQKNLISALLLAVTIALPAYADEVQVGANAEVRGGKISLTQKLQNVFEFRKDDRNDDKGGDRDGRASSTASTTPKLHDSKGGFLGNIAGMRVKNVGKLFQALINRFEKMIDRIESRRDKIDAAGGNTTEADASITLANSNLTQAKADLAAFLALDFKVGSSTHASSTASTTLEAKYQQAKTLATKVRDDLRKVKESLMKAVSSLVAVQKTIKVNVNATSTATSTNH